jgi:FtsH-binding integral membrane protein
MPTIYSHQGYQSPSYQAEIDGPFKKSAAEVDDRLKFIRKVYLILSSQLAITFGFVLFVTYASSSSTKFLASPGLVIGASIASLVCSWSIICCFRNKAPINMILLFLFTIFESITVGALTRRYPAEKVILAMLATVLVTTALTIYAWTTKV